MRLTEQHARAALESGCEAVIFFADASMLRGRITWVDGGRFGYVVAPFAESVAHFDDVVRIRQTTGC